MSKRGRKPLTIPTIEWKLRIPVDIACKIDMITLDPVRMKVAYGSRSELVTILLREFLAIREKTPVSPAPALDSLGDINV
jgi:hypothetical protein